MSDLELLIEVSEIEETEIGQRNGQIVVSRGGDSISLKVQKTDWNWDCFLESFVNGLNDTGTPYGIDTVGAPISLFDVINENNFRKETVSAGPVNVSVKNWYSEEGKIT